MLGPFVPFPAERVSGSNDFVRLTFAAGRVSSRSFGKVVGKPFAVAMFGPVTTGPKMSVHLERKDHRSGGPKEDDLVGIGDDY